MECSKPDGCPDPLECSGNGVCGAQDSFDCESCTFGSPESMSAESHTFSEPLDLTVRRLEAELLELRDQISRLLNG